ncbi:MAG TPA: 3-oxo-tetronate 4-phosphate decarboxylase [Geminicoccus sp.]|jgi:ribulose-5-phosphate 4-epimerase/fuculose-1-phosphate aldolase|uniref:3-oxo-tetronate 4-phosphate decarboxylase n=1 Tax=Geminicoccus sp. TaxID=2024832 RepID=UPI002E3225EA|nr:3-oxo-tetronate 4-phosphate decarboxylase [Geminicoccus sp.]HEX2527637.1 3-oxo-tetronate 4-phosphate decarboxylase [Geminicoccus sp.]
MSSESQLREQICTIGKSIFDRGLTSGSTGNISARLDDGTWLMTPTNASLGRLDPGRISRLDAAGRLLSGDPPSKEIPLHSAMYDERSGSGAIVHLHSTHSVAVSMLPEVDPENVLPPLTAYYCMRCGRVPLIPYFIPGDPALGDAIRGVAGKASTVLLANHGPVVAGKDLEAATNAVEELEETAKLYLMLRNLNPRLLTPEQVAEIEAKYPIK